MCRINPAIENKKAKLKSTTRKAELVRFGSSNCSIHNRVLKLLESMTEAIGMHD